MSKWRNDQPPNETTVEARHRSSILQVQAVYGRDGLRPHWRSVDGDTLYAVDYFEAWRPLAEPAPTRRRRWLHVKSAGETRTCGR